MKSMLRLCLILAALVSMFSPSPLHAQDAARRINNIVLVHGAWVDGSGWKPVSDILTKRGFHVDIVQIPETSLEADVAAVQRILARQIGRCILVGHSYGGSVITEAGVSPKVAGLVYVAAHAPDIGEDESTLGAKTPSALAQTKGAVQVTRDGFTYLKPELFPVLFAPDLRSHRAEFMARSQVLAAAKVFRTPLTAAAWRSKPSWGIVAGADQIISPELEKWYYIRAKSQWIVVDGVGHDIYEARPKIVASVIEKAAQKAGK